MGGELEGAEGEVQAEIKRARNKKKVRNGGRKLSLPS